MANKDMSVWKDVPLLALMQSFDFPRLLDAVAAITGDWRETLLTSTFSALDMRDSLMNLGERTSSLMKQMVHSHSSGCSSLMRDRMKYGMAITGACVLNFIRSYPRHFFFIMHVYRE